MSCILVFLMITFSSAQCTKSSMLQNKIYSKLLQTPEGRKMCGALVKHAGRKKMSTKDFFTRDWMLLEVMNALIKARPEAVPLPTFILSHFQTPGEWVNDGETDTEMRNNERDWAWWRGSPSTMHCKCKRECIPMRLMLLRIVIFSVLLLLNMMRVWALHV